jgi:hypothetical protein
MNHSHHVWRLWRRMFEKRQAARAGAPRLAGFELLEPRVVLSASGIHGVGRPEHSFESRGDEHPGRAVGHEFTARSDNGRGQEKYEKYEDDFAAPRNEVPFRPVDFTSREDDDGHAVPPLTVTPIAPPFSAPPSQSPSFDDGGPGLAVLTPHLQNAPEAPSEIFQSIPQSSSEIVQSFPHDPIEIFERIPHAPSGIFQSVSQDPSEIFQNVQHDPIEIFEKIPHAPSEIFQSVSQAPLDILDNGSHDASEVLENVPRAASEIFQTVSQAPLDILDNVSHAAPEILETVSHAASEVLENVQRAASEIFVAPSLSTSLVTLGPIAVAVTPNPSSNTTTVVISNSNIVTSVFILPYLIGGSYERRIENVSPSFVSIVRQSPESGRPAVTSEAPAPASLDGDADSSDSGLAQRLGASLAYVSSIFVSSEWAGYIAGMMSEADDRQGEASAEARKLPEGDTDEDVASLDLDSTEMARQKRKAAAALVGDDSSLASELERLADLPTIRDAFALLREVWQAPDGAMVAIAASEQVRDAGLPSDGMIELLAADVASFREQPAPAANSQALPSVAFQGEVGMYQAFEIGTSLVETPEIAQVSDEIAVPVAVVAAEQEVGAE